MENKEKIEQLKKLETEIRAILANTRDQKLITGYRNLLHKSRLTRLNLQIEYLGGINPANTLLKPCGHSGTMTNEKSFNVNTNVDAGQSRFKSFKGDQLKKNIDELQKGKTEQILNEFRKKKLRKV